MKKIVFSILIPTYKSRFLKEAIESVLSQSYSHFEIVIVDDCSPENIRCVVDSYVDDRIRYYRNDYNIGGIDVVENWNRCLNYAIGDFVICMGDDDMLCSNCLEEYLFLIDKYPNLNVFHGMTEMIDENGQICDAQDLRPEFEPTSLFILNRWRGRKQYIGDFLFRTTVLKSLGGFYKVPLAWGSDDISAAMVAGSDGIANTYKTVFLYRYSGITISRNHMEKYKMQAVLEEEDWYRVFMESLTAHNERERIFVKLLFNEFFRYFSKKKAMLMADSISYNPLSVFYWLSCRRQLKISFSYFLYGLLMSFFVRINSKNRIS